MAILDRTLSESDFGPVPVLCRCGRQDIPVFLGRAFMHKDVALCHAGCRHCGHVYVVPITMIARSVESYELAMVRLIEEKLQEGLKELRSVHFLAISGDPVGPCPHSEKVHYCQCPYCRPNHYPEEVKLIFEKLSFAYRNNIPAFEKAVFEERVIVQV